MDSYPEKVTVGYDWTPDHKSRVEVKSKREYRSITLTGGVEETRGYGFGSARVASLELHEDVETGLAVVDVPKFEAWIARVIATPDGA